MAGGHEYLDPAAGAGTVAVDCRAVAVVVATKGVAADGDTEVIVLGVSDGPGAVEFLVLTLDDARRLGQLLREAIREPRPGGAGPGAGCVPP